MIYRKYLGRQSMNELLQSVLNRDFTPNPKHTLSKYTSKSRFGEKSFPSLSEKLISPTTKTLCKLDRASPNEMIWCVYSYMLYTRKQKKRFDLVFLSFSCAMRALSHQIIRERSMILPKHKRKESFDTHKKIYKNVRWKHYIGPENLNGNLQEKKIFHFVCGVSIWLATRAGWERD